MDLSWYERVTEEFESTLYDTCELIAALLEDGMLEVKCSKLQKHPSIDLLVYDGEEIDEIESIIPISFDPFNQEFYIQPSSTGESKVRFIFNDTSELFEYIHDTIHNMIESDEEEEDEEEVIDQEFLLENQVDWLTNGEYTKEVKVDVPFDHNSKISYKVGKHKNTGEILIMKNVSAELEGENIGIDNSILQLDEEATRYIVNTIKDNYFAS